MKTEEDEAFDDLAKRQGAWGGGFPAKRRMAADKLQEHWRDYFVNCKHCGKEKLIQRGNHHPWCACGSDEFDWGNQRLAQPAHCQCTACKDGIIHASDCAVHNGPAYPAGECDCGVEKEHDYKVALNEWLDKTEWVQEKINSGHLGARYLGMHRADVLRDLSYPNTVTGKAPAQPAQELVAWMQADHEHISLWEDVYHTIPLYTKPPQREWVGLTDEEIEDLYFDKFSMGELKAFAKAIEQLLKEKNE
jgi:hypothetical protein